MKSTQLNNPESHRALGSVSQHENKKYHEIRKSYFSAKLVITAKTIKMN
jgi:hypothetical protein